MLIRVDATMQIGTGHIMRCIALAQAWQARGGQVTFLSHCENVSIRQKVCSEGFQLISIEKPRSMQVDLRETLKRLKSLKDSSDKGFIWVVLDGYHFDSFYQRSIMEAGYPLLVIDDMGHLPYYHADIIVNYNVYAKSIQYNCDRGTELLFGSQYLLMRKEFTKWRKWQRVIPETSHRILITMGGSDSENVTLKVIRSLRYVKSDGLQVKVILGPLNPYDRYVEDAVQESEYRIEILRDVKNMPELMAWADMAVSAGGVTCWEMAFMGLPNLIIILAENQRRGAEELEQSKCSKNLGHHRELSSEKIAGEILSISEDGKVRKAMSEAGQRLIDGSGVDHVLDKLINAALANRRLYQ